MSKFLDESGLAYLWAKVKAYVAENRDGGTAGAVDWANVQNKPDLSVEGITNADIDAITAE